MGEPRRNSFKVKHALSCGDTQNGRPDTCMYLLNRRDHSVSQPCNLLLNPCPCPVKPTNPRPRDALRRNIAMFYLIKPAFKQYPVFGYRERNICEVRTPHPTCVLRRRPSETMVVYSIDAMLLILNAFEAKVVVKNRDMQAKLLLQCPANITSRGSSMARQRPIIPVLQKQYLSICWVRDKGIVIDCNSVQEEIPFQM